MLFGRVSWLGNLSEIEIFHQLSLIRFWNLLAHNGYYLSQARPVTHQHLR